MAVHRTNRPLMIYTSLIFVVAIVMVVVAFLGERHLANTQLQQTVENQGISERASQLSEQNRALLEKNEALEEKVAALTAENTELTEQNAALTKEAEQNEKLYQVFNTLSKNKRTQALGMLKNIFTTDLVDYQKDFYDTLVKECE